MHTTPIGEPGTPATGEPPKRLPVAGLLALAMTGFICIVTETMPAGLLPQMSEGLGISVSMAGQTVTAYAAGSLLAVLPLTALTATWRRRNVLLLTVVGFLAFNTVTALSHDVALTLVARFMAGAAAGLAWSLLAGYARRMVHTSLQGKAMALAMVGTPIALSAGVPAGSWIGALIGWRMAFAIMSALSVLLIGWIILCVPDFPGRRRDQTLSIRHVLATAGVRPILMVVLCWMLGHNILYTYVSPLVAPAGLTGRVDTVLLTFGIAALLGLAFTGRLVDRHLRSSVLVSLLAFLGATLIYGALGTSAFAVYVATAIWGLSFGGAATLLQTALADTAGAGAGADVAMSLNVVTWNTAIAGGGIAGGYLLDLAGATSFPLVVASLIVLGLVTVALTGRHGFPTGERSATGAVAAH